MDTIAINKVSLALVLGALANADKQNAGSSVAVELYLRSIAFSLAYIAAHLPVESEASNES